VFTGSVVILIIALAFVRWIDARTVSELLSVGCLWLVLTLIFEIGLGSLVMGYSWERIVSDYNVLEGGLLPARSGVCAGCRSKDWTIDMILPTY